MNLIKLLITPTDRQVPGLLQLSEARRAGTFPSFSTLEGEFSYVSRGAWLNSVNLLFGR